MTYQELYKFITQDMQMKHVYQPVMLMELLKNKGKASEEKIAKAIRLSRPSAIPTWVV